MTASTSLRVGDQGRLWAGYGGGMMPVQSPPDACAGLVGGSVEFSRSPPHLHIMHYYHLSVVPSRDQSAHFTIS